MAFVIDDIANVSLNVMQTVFTVLSSIYTMLPDALKMVLGVMLISLFLLIFEITLNSFSNLGFSDAQNIRAALTIGIRCDENNQSCAPVWQPYMFSRNLTGEFASVGKDEAWVQQQLDSCLADYKPDDLTANPFLPYSCSCNASTWNSTLSGPVMECSGFQDGYFWTNCQSIGLACMSSVSAEIYEGRKAEIENGLYMLDPLIWASLGMIIPVGKFAYDYYGKMGVWQMIWR